MRLMIATALLVVCAAGCAAPSTTGRVDAPRPSGPSTSTDSSAAENGSPPVIADPTTTVLPGTNQVVTRRVRAALIGVGAEQLVETPGYKGEVNTAFTGLWRGRPFRAYAVPTSDSPSVDGELTLVSTTVIAGRAVEVRQVADGAVRLLRFTRGPDTWLLSSLTPNLVDSDEPRSLALVAELVQ